MTTPNLLFMLMAMMLVAILIEPIAKWVKLPFSAALVLAGFLGSELIVSQGIDTGIRWYTFQDLIFYVFIPVLVFDSAFRLNLRALFRDLVLVLSLAIPLMLLAAGVTAAIIYYGISHATGFPWIAALLAGVLLSATDPVAVVSMLKQNQAPERLAVLLEGESLFNDATAIVVFALLITLAQSGSSVLDWNTIIVRFSVTFFGGLIVGLMVAGIAYLLIRFLQNPEVLSIITIISAYSSYLLAENVFHLSGIMAVLSCGFVFSETRQYRSTIGDWEKVQSLWDFNAYVANAMIFLLAGVTITLAMFSDRWLAMLIGIIAVSVARILSLFGGITVLGWLPGVAPIPLRQQVIITFGGVRGAVALALALSLPLDLDYWFTIQSIAYGVVLFTLFVQAPIMAPIIRRFR